MKSALLVFIAAFASMCASATVVTQEVVAVRSDGTVTSPYVASKTYVQNSAVLKAGANVVDTNSFMLACYRPNGTLVGFLSYLPAYGIWYFSGQASSATSAGGVVNGSYSLELGSDGRPALKSGSTVVQTVPYASETVTHTQLATEVNSVKDLNYDPVLSVTWTNVVSNGHIYYVTVTNTNVSTL